MIPLTVAMGEIFNVRIMADINTLSDFVLPVKNWIVLINRNHTNTLVAIRIKYLVIINAIKNLVLTGKKKLSYHTALKIASFLEFFVQEGVYRYPGLNPHDSPLKIQGETYGP